MLTAAELRDAYNAAVMMADMENIKQERREEALRQQAALGKRLNIDALMAVHLTNYFPQGGVLKPVGISIKLPVGSHEVYFPRETIHFALNGPVGSHMYGEWEGCKFAILIPLRLIFERIVVLSPQDTFLIGELKLPRGTEIVGATTDLQRKNAGAAALIPLTLGEDTFQGTRRRLKEKNYIVATIAKDGWLFDYSAEAEVIRFIGAGEDIIHNGAALQRLIGNTGKECMLHMNTIFRRVEEIASSIYGRMYSKQKTGTLEEIMRSCKNAIKELEQIIDKKKNGPISISAEELAGLNRMLALLKHLYEECTLLDLQETATYNNIKALEELDETEKKWLMREFYLVKNLDAIIKRRDKKKAVSLLRSIGKTERRVYNLYQELKKKLDTLKADARFTQDISDIEEQLTVWEAHTATVLSRGGGKLSELIETENWIAAEKQVETIENIIIAMEETIKRLQEVLSSRERYYNV